MLIFENKSAIVFAGDSVTDSGRKRPVGEGLWDGVGNGYVRSIDTLLNVYYPEYFYRIVNMGVSGDNSRNLLSRWQTDVMDLNPDYIVCCIGFNDVWRFFDEPGCKTGVSIEEYRNNLEKMAEASIGKVRKLIFMTPYYMEANKSDEMRVKMTEYASVMKQVAEKYKTDCIDLQKEFDGYLKYRYPAYITWDRIHPGWIGSQIIASAFLRYAGFDRKII